jgi:hypothetical protein
MRTESYQTMMLVWGLRALICLAATTHASSSHVYGMTDAPCHFSSVTIGKRAIVSSASSVKPPPAVPFGSDP